MDSLKAAKRELLQLSQNAGTNGNWDAAERFLRLARELDGVLVSVEQEGERNNHVRQNGSLSIHPERLPKYSREGLKLLKVGRARDGEAQQM